MKFWVRLFFALTVALASGCTPDAGETGSGGSGFVETQPTDGSAREVPDPLLGDPHVESGGSGELAHHTHRAPREPMPPPDAVAYAVYRARYETAQRLIQRLDHRATESGSTPADTKPVRIVFGSNVHGELEDCGCRHNPLGGLARRATMLDAELPEAEEPIAQFHLDTGDLLFRMQGSGEGSGDVMANVESVTALTVLRGLTTMGIDGLVPGPWDLSQGGAFLRAVAAETTAPYVCANLNVGDQPLFPAQRIVERNGFRIGLVGVIADVEPSPGFWAAAGVTVLPGPGAAAPAIRELRRENVGLVVLLASVGVEGADPLVRNLSGEGARPDLVLVSGSQRMMNEPVWIDGIPVLEAGQRGKQIMRVDLALAEAPIDFEPAGGELRDVLRDYMSTLRALNATETSLQRSAHAEQPDPRQDSFLRMRADQSRRRDQIMAQMGGLIPDLSAPVTAPRSRIDVELASVALTIDQRPDIRAIIDAAYATILERFGVTVQIPQH